MDKALIINSIKEYYKFKSDSEFARHLGISSQVLSNWKSRNTFDPVLIYTNCLDINPEWLLTGKGQMIKTVENISMVSDIQEVYAKEEKIIDGLKSQIYYQDQIIDSLRRENKLLWKIVDGENGDNGDNGKKSLG